MAPRPPTSRSHSANSALSSSMTKGLPALPTGGLGLDFSGLSKEDEEFRLSINTTSKPSPTQFSPLRGSPFSASLPPKLPIRSPSIISSSPSTPTTGSAYPFPYINPNHSTSTVLTNGNHPNPNQSTSTLTPVAIAASPSVSMTTPTPKKKIAFSKTSTSADSTRSDDMNSRSPSYQNLNTSTSINRSAVNGLGRKRSSGQLLMGIGKGLNRVSSVMRRNTAETSERADPRRNIQNDGRDVASVNGVLGGTPTTWQKGRRGRKGSQLADESWEQVDRFEFDEGDAGIGRPFNVGHDLHVSPDLGDLPPTWLESLKAQGLTESDLLLISAARKKQHGAPRIPLHHPSLSVHRSDQSHSHIDSDGSGEGLGRPPRAPLSAPAPMAQFLGMPFQPESPFLKTAIPLVDGGASTSRARTDTGDNPAKAASGTSLRPPGSKGLLMRKFSFERSVRPAALRARTKDVFDSKPIDSGSASDMKLRSAPHGQKNKVDSYPYAVSASGHSDSLSHVTSSGYVSDQIRGKGVFTAGEESSEVVEIVAKENDARTATRKNKRFSDQLKGFRESTFGPEEVDEDWGSSIISAAWTGTNASSSSSSQGLRPGSATSSRPPALERVKERDFRTTTSCLISDRIPLPSTISHFTEAKSSAPLQRSSTPPAQPSSPPISPRSPPPPPRPRRSIPSTSTPQNSEPNTPMAAAPRESSESFGVHYSVSKSSTSIASDVITPCTSVEQGVEICDSEKLEAESDFDTSGYRASDQSHHFAYLARLRPDIDQQEQLAHNKGKGKAAEQDVSPDNSAEFELQNTSFGAIMRPVLGDAIQPHDSTLPVLPHLPRRYHSNPRVSLPASAGQSSALPSRCVTPIDTASAAVTGRCHHERSESGNHPATEQLSPPRDMSFQVHEVSTPCRLKPQASYSTFDSTPFRPATEGEDPLDGLDKAITPDERASIALSILSSRTSTSMHSLHELSQATVRVAYKMPGRSTSDTSVPTRESLRATGSGGGGESGEMEESASSECSGFSIAGGYGSEETGEEARDAMDALGEAARRLRGM
ncbi:hypothetical protein I317_04043 [Kwoniella heveanensis CBS 569]|nr:hypothetical protein I317_04043 [Kwoniella heveanensis CBS 569]